MKMRIRAGLAAGLVAAAVFAAATPAVAATSQYGSITCPGGQHVRVYGYASGTTVVHTSSLVGNTGQLVWNNVGALTYHSYTSSFLTAADFTGISTSSNGHIQKGGDGKACA